jgi:LacI family fructose operon transcriptional repressor
MDHTLRKATIHDIARLSGASPSTVSAALSDNWKRRRISEARVEEIRRIAAEQGYSINMQARGLRQARSGLVGMIIPVHDNRFFSSMSQSFEAFARDRGLVPVIASSLRDPEEERRIVRTLISYAVDCLFIAGATAPEEITALCRAAGLRHVFIDLPGPGAPSVISDNHGGAAQLTQRLLADMTGDDSPRGRIYLIGGVATDYATARRIEGFRDVLTAAGQPPAPDQIIACGYPPRRAMQEIAALCDRLGGLPAALFVNSLTAFEGHRLSVAPMMDWTDRHCRVVSPADDAAGDALYRDGHGAGHLHGPKPRLLDFSAKSIPLRCNWAGRTRANWRRRCGSPALGL